MSEEQLLPSPGPLWDAFSFIPSTISSDVLELSFKCVLVAMDLVLYAESVRRTYKVVKSDPLAKDILSIPKLLCYTGPKYMNFYFGNCFLPFFVTTTKFAEFSKEHDCSFQHLTGFHLIFSLYSLLYILILERKFEIKLSCNKLINSERIALFETRQ
jgi:hypothetical protein